MLPLRTLDRKMRARVVIVLKIVLLALSSLACGTMGSACYPQYPSCEATASAIRNSPQYNGY